MDLKGNHKFIIKIKKLKELFRINQVITLLKFKSAVNLQCFLLEAQSRERILLRNLIRSRSLDCASNKKHCKFTADLNFKSVITLLILNSSFSFVSFIINLWFPLRSTFYFDISRFTCSISGTVCLKRCIKQRYKTLYKTLYKFKNVNSQLAYSFFQHCT